MSDQQTLEYLMAEVTRLREREAQLERDFNGVLKREEAALVRARKAEARVAELEEALRWCLEHRDSERFFSVGEAALAHKEETP